MRTEQERPLTELEDEHLISRCLEGEEAAWEVLIVRYQRLVYSIPVRYGFKEDVAADVFQAVCTRLIEHLGALKDRSKLASWLITTTTRECWRASHRLRREAPIGEMGDFDEVPRYDLPDQRALPEDEQLELERQQMVRSAVSILPERCRELVELLYFAEDRPSYEEISRRLDMPVSSIGPTRGRCLEKLRKVMEQEGDV